MIMKKIKVNLFSKLENQNLEILNLLTKYLQLLKTSVENDDVLQILFDENIIEIILKFMKKFKKDTYFAIKNIIYKIFGNIFTLDNKYLEVKNFIILEHS